MSQLLVGLILVLTCLCSAEEAFDPPAPKWLQEAEIFNGCYFKPSQELVQDVFPKFSCIVGGIWSGWTVEKLHKLGVRVIPYIDFVQSPWPEKGSTKEYTITFEGHADWIRVDKEGNYMPTFYAPNKGWYQGCFNAVGFQEACLEKVRRAMQSGVDGLFFDDCGSCRAECYGPQFGKHEHVNEDWDGIDAMDHFLVEARKIIKSFGDDKILMMNAWRPRRRWLKVCDCQMWESFINGPSRAREYNLSNMQYIADHWADYEDTGKRIVALAYSGSTTGDVKEDAYFAYAWARLLGFPWADWFTLKDKPGRELYDVKLGKYLQKHQKLDSVMFRACENGVVVTTIRDGEQSVTIPLPAPFRHVRLLDVYSGAPVPVDSGKLTVTLPNRAGRVYVAQPTGGEARAE